jgi:hypothetical protein
VYKVKNFDPVKYQQLLEEFGKCRRGVKGHTIFESLLCISPGGYMSDDLKIQLDKWCDTNRSASWGNCVKPAQAIRDFLLEKEG